MSSKFLNRHQAGKQLAQELIRYVGPERGLVLALPRGGVPIGYEIACALNWSLDIWLVRKLGAPDQPELAIGAIALPHTKILNSDLITKLQVSKPQLEAVIQSEKQELNRRNQCYRQAKPLPAIAHKSVILVDDGIATGATMQAAVAALHAHQPSDLTVAVPVAAPGSLHQIQNRVDHIICPLIPEIMGSISQWYDNFEPVTDDEVVALLGKDLNDEASRTNT